MLSINNMIQYFMIKRFLPVLAGLVLIFGMSISPVAYAALNSVIAARVWPAQDYTRITLEAGKPIVYRMTVLKNPERVVVDIDDVDVNPALKSLSEKIHFENTYIVYNQVFIININECSIHNGQYSKLNG